MFYNFKWTVKVVDKIDTGGDDEEDGEGLNTKDLVGYMDTDSRTIQLLSSADSKTMAVTLLHELLHLAFPRELVSPKLEETIIAQLEMPLYYLLEETLFIDKDFTVT